MMDAYERDVYEEISSKEVIEILKSSNVFSKGLNERCKRLEQTYTDLQDNPIVQLVRNNGESADKEYFRIVETQKKMLKDLDTEFDMLTKRYMQQHRIMIALRLIPDTYAQCIQGVYIEGQKWDAVQVEQQIGSTVLGRNLQKGVRLIAKIYNLDKSNEELVRSYIDVTSLSQKKKKPANPDCSEADCHQVTISELLQ